MSAAEGRVDQIRSALQAAFRPQRLEIRDDSEQHRGHRGAAGGAGHYHVEIVSAAFAGLPPLARHRRVYEALAAFMPAEIHALSLRTKTPDET